LRKHVSFNEQAPCPFNRNAVRAISHRAGNRPMTAINPATDNGAIGRMLRRFD